MKNMLENISKISQKYCDRGKAHTLTTFKTNIRFFRHIFLYKGLKNLRFFERSINAEEMKGANLNKTSNFGMTHIYFVKYGYIHTSFHS